MVLAAAADGRVVADQVYVATPTGTFTGTPSTTFANFTGLAGPALPDLGTSEPEPYFPAASASPGVAAPALAPSIQLPPPVADDAPATPATKARPRTIRPA